MPYRLRKNLRYHGGIRIQHGEVRMTVHNSELDTRNRAAKAVHYHDPGNFIYALAMRLMWPEFGECGYNQEAMGDISEGILALHVFYGTEWGDEDDPVCTLAHVHLESYLRQVARFGSLANDSIWACKTVGECTEVVVQLLAANTGYLDSLD